MIQQQVPIRRGMLIPHEYQFFDQDDNIISLVNCVSAFMQVKLQGQPAQTLSASFVQQSNGTVSCDFTYDTIGIWTTQFYCVDGVGEKMWGEPVLFRVVPNVEDLALSELPNY